MVGESPHSFQQELSDSAQESDWHPCCQVLLRQVEHTGTGCQLDVQGCRVILHTQNYKLEKNAREKRSNIMLNETDEEPEALRCGAKVQGFDISRRKCD